MSKHTPGPWHLSLINRELCLPESITYRPSEVSIGGRVLRIANDTSADADARLIAAAPELLAHLAEVTELAAYAIENATDSEWAVIESARAAIAKARGEA